MQATTLVPAEVEAQVSALERPEGWDCEEAPAITAQTCREAIRFLAEARDRFPSLPLPESIAPSATGAVSFFWTQGAHRILIELSAMDSETVYLQWLDGG